MKKFALLLCMTVLFMGCSYIPWFAKENTKSVLKSTNSIIITKKQAIEYAKIFVKNEGFRDDFHIKKASKIKKRLTMESDPKWVWDVYFLSKNRSFWKFWHRPTMMVEVNAESGRILRWGKR